MGLEEWRTPVRSRNPGDISLPTFAPCRQYRASPQESSYRNALFRLWFLSVYRRHHARA